MKVTATEFKRNVGKYLELVQQGDLTITRYGQTVARLVSPIENKIKTLNSLVGIADSRSEDDDFLRSERLARQ